MQRMPTVRVCEFCTYIFLHFARFFLIMKQHEMWEIIEGEEIALEVLKMIKANNFFALGCVVSSEMNNNFLNREYFFGWLWFREIICVLMLSHPTLFFIFCILFKTLFHFCVCKISENFWLIVSANVGDVCDDQLTDWLGWQRQVECAH